jgi:hypothetical protein
LVEHLIGGVDALVMAAEYRAEHRQGVPLPATLFDEAAQLTVARPPQRFHEIEHVRAREPIEAGFVTALLLVSLRPRLLLRTRTTRLDRAERTFGVGRPPVQCYAVSAVRRQRAG